MFKAAGISGPPKTMSELDADAVKLTKTSGDGYSQLGFVPDYHFYESTITHFGAQWGPTYFDSDGKSNVANDPGLKSAIEWQKAFLDKLGGYDQVDKFRTSAGEEFSNNNAFMTGQVAMMIDGEWRAGMIDDSNSKVDYGVAPFPVPDDQADQYGKGYITGTIVGIASTSEKQNAAWEFVKYLTTDTSAVVNFANAIHNVPSTHRGAGVTGRQPGPELPAVHQDRVRTRTAPRRRPAPTAVTTSSSCRTWATTTSPASRPTSGGARRRGPPDRHEHRPGPVTVDGFVAIAGRPRPSRRRGRPGAQAAATGALRNLAFLSPWLLGTGLFFLYPLASTAYLSFTQYDGFVSPTWNGLDNWKFVLPGLPVLLAGDAQHAVVRRRAW